MPVENWLNPEDVPDFAAHATAMIDAALTGSGLTRESYWAAVRKGYNTPYNDPPRRGAAPAQPTVIATIAGPAEEPMAVPAAVIAALATEARAL
ncbi:MULTISPECIES: hypothetical protein [Methylobacterium]|uniref:Uncharacterized protein n=1 Tax=Methylobacterium longum TaxID=767694 RepID=A0ABT8ATU3_9HYPH|nr:MULTISPECIES: hypothetical protein [Methylobacterium]MCJ2099078.1 hypothetical protein [Methylobacterium sp. E-046]MDN3572840.1 hypothetical protein [Methylobacterium longum]GJE10034.1 hypothetical protein FOHLNKBM_1064 [Methylobacterium longum]